MPSSYRRELSTAAPGIEDRIRMLSNEGNAGGETTPNSTSPLEAGKLTERVEEEEEGNIGEIAAAEVSLPKEKELSIPLDSPPDEDKHDVSSLANETAQPSFLEDETTLTDTAITTTTATASSTSATSASTSPISVSPTDQDTTTSVPASSTVTSSTSHEEGVTGDDIACSYGNGIDQLKLLTAASWSRSSDKRDVSPARFERNNYEKLTMEAAALSREKWKQSEGMDISY